uniref:Uncharacterized protein n=1 Tax=Cajanus cajan TaxID=3821 RepID=A0A151TXJ5_CAJCA|nr:hypothetical protein KK1_011010 [Cajanus cajan]
MGTPASIGINDDLSSSETSITVGATNDKTTRRVKVEDGLLIQVLLRNDRLDNMLFKVSSNLVIAHSLIMLVLPSGLNQAQVPSFLTSVRRAPNLAFVSIETNIIGDESNAAACVTDNLLIVYIGLGCDLTKDHDHVGLGACLTGNLAVRILFKACIEHCIGDLVA